MYDNFEPKRVAQGLPPLEAERRERWLDAILASGSHIVIEVDGRIVGHGMLLPFEDDGAELANFLHQAVRDRGIGTVLNRALIDAGHELGLRRIWLSVQPSNRRAIRSYEKAGFRRQVVSAWAPELEMELVLTDGPEPD